MIFSFERGSSGSHYIESSLWKRFWTCRKTDYFNEMKVPWRILKLECGTSSEEAFGLYSVGGGGSFPIRILAEASQSSLKGFRGFSLQTHDGIVSRSGYDLQLEKRSRFVIPDTVYFEVQAAS
jgi:hypothetical protein